MKFLGTITAAFLNGDDMDRGQPRTGLEGLDPRQLLRITKGVFGLPDSPRKWWKRLRRDTPEVRIKDEGKEYFFEQCPLNPCLFQLVSSDDRTPRAYVGVHVDDLLVVGPRALSKTIRASLSSTFPVDDWEINDFDYIGSDIR